MKNVLYFHGFASSPKGRKVEALRKILEPEGFSIDAPDLNVPSFERLSFGSIVELARHRAEAIDPDVVVGSSLGALVALSIERDGVGAPLLLIAPALRLGHRWIENVPAGDPVEVYNYAADREMPIHRAFFEEMSNVDIGLEPPRNPVTILMGQNDESVPIDIVWEVWRAWEESGQLAAGSSFTVIPKGDHGLTLHVDRIADEIRKSASGGKRS